MNTKNIILIGMPGCGKSTVGVVLAKILGYDFMDSDLLIQAKHKKKLHQIISEEGLDGFLRIEDEVNSEIETEGSVIATGGSAVYGANAMAHLKSIGTVVYIKLSLRTLKRRLGDLKKRGVAMKDGYTLADLYEERIPLYEKYADVVIEADKLQLKDVANEICKQLDIQ